MAEPKSDLKLTVGSTSMNLMLQRGEDGRALFTRYPANPLNPIVNQSGTLSYAAQNPEEGITKAFEDFSLGAGGFTDTPGRYNIGTNVDCRRKGKVHAGPLEVADMTGIAANEQVVKQIEHNGVAWLITTTTSYRVSGGAWVETGANGVGWTVAAPTDIVSLGGVVAIAKGASTAFQYSVDDGANWVTSTLTGNAKYANLFSVVAHAGNAPKIAMVRNPNELYFLAALINGSTVTTSSTVGDTVNDEFNSITESSSGILFLGKRERIYTIDSAGYVRVVAGPYRYIATSDAGSGAGLANFRAVVHVEQRIYWNYEDYFILEYDDSNGTFTEHMEPGQSGPDTPRMQMPINCMTNAHGWLVVGLGSSNSTLKSTTMLAGTNNGASTSALIGNQFGTKTEFYWGQYVETEQGRVWVWHGIMLVSSKLAQYAWMDSVSGYLYIADSQNALVNASQVRAFIARRDPLSEKNPSGNIDLAPTWVLETGKYYQDQPSVTKTFRTITIQALPTLSSSGTHTLAYAFFNNEDFTTETAYNAFVTFNSATTARGVNNITGNDTSWYVTRFKFTGTTSDRSQIVMLGAQETHLFYPPIKDICEFTIKSVNSQVDRTGARSIASWSQLRALIDSWKDSTTPATLTDLATSDQWAVKLDTFRETGLGKDRIMSMVAHETSGAVA